MRLIDMLLKTDYGFRSQIWSSFTLLNVYLHQKANGLAALKKVDPSSITPELIPEYTSRSRFGVWSKCRRSATWPLKVFTLGQILRNNQAQVNDQQQIRSRNCTSGIVIVVVDYLVLPGNRRLLISDLEEMWNNWKYGRRSRWALLEKIPERSFYYSYGMGSLGHHVN